VKKFIYQEHWIEDDIADNDGTCFAENNGLRSDEREDVSGFQNLGQQLRRDCQENTK
jgi:hypothetical protein